MIWWLFGHAWWGLPVLLGLIAAAFALLGAWPLLLAILGRLPPRLQVLLLVLGGALVASSGLYAIGLDHGQERCQNAQETAESRADAKAIKAGGRASAKAEEASATIQKETDHAAAEVRVILRDRACPAAPERVHELGQRAVERARGALRPGPH